MHHRTDSISSNRPQARYRRSCLRWWPEAAGQHFENPSPALALTSLNESSANSHSFRRRVPRRCLLPQLAVPQNLFDDLVLISPDEADHLHLTGALGTDQRVHLIHLFDQCRPPPPSVLGAGSRRPVLGGGWRGLSLAFRAQSPALVRVEA